MRKYKSALVLPNGDLVHHEATNSHEDLIAWVGLSDSTPHPAFVRVEYTGANLANINTYALRVDQDYLPPWWNAELAEDVARRMRGICERAIVTDKRRRLLGGAWVLAGDAKIDVAQSARIVQMCGSSQVGTMRGSSWVGEMCVVPRRSARCWSPRRSARCWSPRRSARCGAPRGLARCVVPRRSARCVVPRRSGKIYELNRFRLWGV